MVASRKLIRSRGPVCGARPSAWLFAEIDAGLLEPLNAGRHDRSGGLFLLYRRAEHSAVAGDFRLILAPSVAVIREYSAGQALVARVRLQYPGQLAAAERFFGAPLEPFTCRARAA